MGETIVLDPTAEATNRTQLDLTPWVSADGIDWGDAVFEAIAAQSERGDLVVDGRLPNRVITVPLKLRTVGATSFTTIRQSIQQKVGLLQREGGWVMRQVGSTPLYADVVNATLHLGGSWLQAFRDIDVDAVLTLECVPDWYGAEVDLGDNVETTLPELIFTDTGVTGNYPGRVRVVIDEDQGQNQLGLLWGFRCRNYSNASTAALAYAGTALQRLDTAGTAGGAVVHTNLAIDWTPVLGTNLGGTAYLTHQGSYRVWAAVGSTVNGDDVTCRFVWDVGDLVNPVENPPYTVPGSDGYYLADLGEIRLDQAPAGTHRWQGMIQAKGVAGGEDIEIQRLWFQPLDEGSGRLMTPLRFVEGLSAFAARDEYAQTAGTLNGKVLPVGGTWVGSGDTDDFSTTGSGEITRTAVSDAGNLSRYEIAGTATFTDTVVQVDVKTDSTSIQDFVGPVARYTDTNNWLQLRLVLNDFDAGSMRLVVTESVAGVIANLMPVLSTPFTYVANTYYTARLEVDAAGHATGSLWRTDQPDQVAIVRARRASLATGGALASGKVGIHNLHSSASATTRTYDNFRAWVPKYDAVIYANRTLELRTEGAYRVDVGGTAYGPVSHVVGSLPRIPPSGLESRTVQTFLKSSRGDFEVWPDGGNADDTSARMFYRPSFLYVN